MSFFETRLAFRRFWVKEPRHSENKIAEMCHLYRRTRPQRPTNNSFERCLVRRQVIHCPRPNLSRLERSRRQQRDKKTRHSSHSSGPPTPLLGDTRKRLLRGTIVNRTYGIHKKISILNNLYYQYLVLLTTVPRNRKKKTHTINKKNKEGGGRGGCVYSIRNTRRFAPRAAYAAR